MPNQFVRTAGLGRLRAMFHLLMWGAAACSKDNAPAALQTDGAPAAATASAASLATAAGKAQPLADEVAARAVVVAWSGALDDHDLARLTKIYAPRVKLYGSELSRADVIQAKKQAFAGDPKFKQQIALPIAVTKINDTFVATFTKRSGGAKKSNIRARVVVENGLVSEESDASTDKRIAETAVTVTDPCELAVREAALAIPACKTAIDGARSAAAKSGHFSDTGSPLLHHVEQAAYVHEWQFSPSPSHPTEILASASYTEDGELSVSCDNKDAAIPAVSKGKVKAACSGYFDRVRKQQ